MELVGFWTPLEGEEAKDTLYYLLAFPAQRRRRRRGRTSATIPNGSKVKADSEKDGVLVKKVDSTSLKATDYSPLR